MKAWLKLAGIAAGATLLIGAATQAPIADANWPTYGGSGENHYSALEQITAANVKRLGLAWYHDIDVAPNSLTAPVAVNGVLYFAAGHSVVHALDARTGKLLWKYDPEVYKVAGQKMRGAWGIRGIAYSNGKIFTGTIDGRLIAIDAKTGKMLWSQMTVGKDDERYVTGAPWVFKNKVIIGHGGADYAPVRGYVTAYDQNSGKQLWRFYTVPGDPSKGFENKAMEMAAKTWKGEWWKFGGGGTAWNAMSYDPQFNRIYIGTGNGSPWNQKIRSPGGGDNLFLCSVIALDADTGEYVWHYQFNPGETWDYNAAMDMELADLNIGGKLHHVMMTVPKNGFYYVIDRTTGKLISANNIVPVNWAKRIDIATGRPVENPEARYPDGQAAIVYPSPFGAHNIEAMSFNPKSGLAYIPSMDQARVYVDPAGKLTDWKYYDGQRLSTGTGAPPPLKTRPPSSALIAWNPVTQREAWRVPLPSIRGGGGTATTAGNLVFQGNAGGQFVAYAADTGKKLWSFFGQTAVMAQPITYLAGGKQYVTVIAGSRFSSAVGLPQEWDYRTQKWRVLTFALDGGKTLPAPDTKPAPPVDDPAFKVDPAQATAGATIYGQRCAGCHGGNGMAGGTAPSLLSSPMPLDIDAFKSVLSDGVLEQNGMPRFEELTPQEMAELQHFIRKRAREELAKPATAASINRGPHEGQ